MTMLRNLVLLLVPLLAAGALPPMSNAALQDRATHVVQGVVGTVTSSKLDDNNGLVKDVYAIQLTKPEFIKGSVDKAGDVTVTLWKRHSDSKLSVGDQGHSGAVPKTGDQIKAYVSLDEDGSLHALNPNGIRIVSGGATAAAEEPTTPQGIVQKLIADNKIVVFSKSYCGYSMKAKNAFKELGVPHKVVELDQHPQGQQLQSALRELTGRGTVPNVFISGKSVGGGDDMQRMLKTGELLKMAQA